VSVFRPDKGRVMLSNADGTPLFAVPANAGPRTMDYAALYAAGTYRNLVATPATLDAAEAKVFAGTTNDGFWIDLGGTFDTLNLRTLGSGVPGVLTAAEDAAQRNFAPDFVSGFAVNTLAVEVPIEWLTSGGRRHRATDPEATIGVWATTSRQATLVRRPNITIPPTGTDAVPVNTESGPFRQVQRMGNPLVNELLIGIRFKDKFSIRPPQFDFEYINFLLDPVLVRIAEALYGAAGVRLAVPPPPRTDLLPLVHYLPPIAAPDTPPGPIADLLRLNTGVPATPPGSPGFSRLGLLGRDGAGFPNGRRLTDDVVDVTLRVVVGGVLNPTFPGYTPGIHDRLGDGVNVDDVPYQPSFPYIGFCPPGANRVHCDPGERGCGPLVN